MKLLTRTALLALLTLGAANLAFAQSGGGSGGSGDAGGSGGSSSSSNDGSRGGSDRETGGGPGAIGGESSPGVLVNPQSSQGAMQSGRLSESDVRSMLQQRGYTQVGEIESSGGAYSARAMRNGQTVDVRIDPQTGTITER